MSAVGVVLPYLLLSLLWIDEPAAVLILILFVIPLLDTFFFVETPKQDMLDQYWTKLCVWMWFPCLLHVVFHLQTAGWSTWLSLGFLYGTSVNASQMLMECPSSYENTMGFLMEDFLLRSHSTRSVVLWCLLINKFPIHVFSCVIGNLLHLWMNYMDTREWCIMPCSSFWIGNYMFYRFRKDDRHVIPASYTWLLFLWLAERYDKKIFFLNPIKIKREQDDVNICAEDDK